MDTEVRLAKLEDIKYITHLANVEKHALGFIPKPAYEAAITGIKSGKRWSLTCNDRLWVAEENGYHVGFVLASFGQTPKVNQIVLQEDARKLERGRMLLGAVVQHGASIGRTNYSCGCADDLESNKFWAAMGWIKKGERFGRSHKNTWKDSSDRLINLYHYSLLQPHFPFFEVGNG